MHLISAWEHQGRAPAGDASYAVMSCVPGKELRTHLLTNPKAPDAKQHLQYGLEMFALALWAKQGAALLQEGKVSGELQHGSTRAVPRMYVQVMGWCVVLLLGWHYTNGALLCSMPHTCNCYPECSRYGACVS
jgi:hypothetical protein